MLLNQKMLRYIDIEKIPKKRMRACIRGDYLITTHGGRYFQTSRSKEVVEQGLGHTSTTSCLLQRLFVCKIKWKPNKTVAEF